MPASSLRAAFLEAVQGCQKLVGAEAFPDRGIEAAKTEVSRTLGDNADRRPTFELLEIALARGNPEPVLDYLGELLQVRWERIPDVPSVLRQRAIARMAEIGEQLDLLRDELATADAAEEQDRGRAPLRRVEPRLPRDRREA